MGRPAQPEEIAPSYVFLASDIDSSFMTGQARRRVSPRSSRAGRPGALAEHLQRRPRPHPATDLTLCCAGFAPEWRHDGARLSARAWGKT